MSDEHQNNNQGGAPVPPPMPGHRPQEPQRILDVSEDTEIISEGGYTSAPAEEEDLLIFRRRKNPAAAAERQATATTRDTGNNPQPVQQPVEQPAQQPIQPEQQQEQVVEQVPPTGNDGGGLSGDFMPKPKRNMKPLIIIFIVLGVLIIGLLVWFLFFKDSSSSGRYSGRSHRDRDRDYEQTEQTVPVPLSDEMEIYDYTPSDSVAATTPNTEANTDFLHGYFNDAYEVNMVLFDDGSALYCYGYPYPGSAHNNLEIADYDYSTGRYTIDEYNSNGQYVGYWNVFIETDPNTGDQYLDGYRYLDNGTTMSILLYVIPASESGYNWVLD